MNTLPLTTTRFIAAIFVVTFHFGRHVHPFNDEIFKYLILNGDKAVSYFFFLSGFVMAIKYLEEAEKNLFRTKKYLWDRFSRIYPIYFVALILVIFQWIRIWDKEIDPQDLLLNLSLMQSWFSGKELSFNYPGWSLSVEVFFYLLFPFLIKMIIRVKTTTFIYASIVFWLLSQLIFYLDIISRYNPIMSLNTFISGLLLGVLILRFQNRFQQLRSYAPYILLLSTLLLPAILSFPNVIGRNSHNGLLVPVFFMLLYGFVYTNNRVTRFMSNKYVVVLGEISYGIYILQYPCLIFVRTYINKNFEWAIYYERSSDFFVYILILIVFSVLSYFFIETPLKRFIRAKIIVS